MGSWAETAAVHQRGCHHRPFHQAPIHEINTIVLCPTQLLLCPCRSIVDRQPRTLDEEGCRLLVNLAGMAMRELENASLVRWE